MKLLKIKIIIVNQTVKPTDNLLAMRTVMAIEILKKTTQEHLDFGQV